MILKENKSFGMFGKHGQYDIQAFYRGEQDKQLIGNDLCDMVRVCGELREIKVSLEWSGTRAIRQQSGAYAGPRYQNVPGVKEALPRTKPIVHPLET
jgi:hypothetical protein